MYITNAATADWLYLLSSPIPTRVRRLLADHRPHRPPGSLPALGKIGNRDRTPACCSSNVRVPINNTIGDPNRSFQQQMMQCQDERMVVVVTAPISAKVLWDATLKHCQERMVFGKPLSKMQVN
jgi:alkylation response protein AidB-like acyl-CoA dehydrogenase